MSHAYVSNVLGALGLALADRLAQACEPVGGQSAAAALVALYGTRAGATIDGLTSVTALSHSGAVRLVDRLEAHELVERRRGADQRSAALYLTPSGRRSARRILADREAVTRSVLSLLTDDQQAQFGDLATELLNRLPDPEARLCRLCDLDACGRSRGNCPVAPSRRRRAVLGGSERSRSVPSKD